MDVTMSSAYLPILEAYSRLDPHSSIIAIPIPIFLPPPLHLPLQLLHRQRTPRPPNPLRPHLPLPPHPPLAAPQPHDQEPQLLPIDIEHLPPRHAGQLDADFPCREVDGRDGEGGGLVREVEELRGEEGGVEMGEGACCQSCAAVAGFFIVGVCVRICVVVVGGRGRGEDAERLQVREGDGVRGREVRGEGERAED